MLVNLETDSAKQKNELDRLMNKLMSVEPVLENAWQRSDLVRLKNKLMSIEPALKTAWQRSELDRLASKLISVEPVAGEVWQKFEVMSLIKQIEPKTGVLCPSPEVQLSQLIQLSKNSCQK